MSIMLYGLISIVVLVVYWLLIEFGIEYELVLLDFDVCEYKLVQYLVFNLVGVVLILLIDGLVLIEVVVIVLYLVDCYLEVGLFLVLGMLQCGDVYCWMFWCVSMLQLVYWVWFYLYEMVGQVNVEVSCEMVCQWFEVVWQYVVVYLQVYGLYLLGVMFCVVDYMLVMLMCWLCNMFKFSDIWLVFKVYVILMKVCLVFVEVYCCEGIIDWW